MRLPYVDPADPKAFTSPDDTAIVARVRARRAPRPLQALDLALLHSPAVADGWNSFLGAIRTKTSLSDDVREVAICRVAVVNEAWYEWGHHAPLAKAGGVSEEGLKILGDTDLLGGTESSELSAKLWAVVRYTDAMTEDVTVEPGVFDELKKHFNEQEVVEITATVCISFRLVIDRSVCYATCHVLKQNLTSRWRRTIVSVAFLWHWMASILIFPQCPTD
jgi:alkylhydroperoxidase family enzyme